MSNLAIECVARFVKDGEVIGSACPVTVLDQRASFTQLQAKYSDLTANDFIGTTMMLYSIDTFQKIGKFRIDDFRLLKGTFYVSEDPRNTLVNNAKEEIWYYKPTDELYIIPMDLMEIKCSTSLDYERIGYL